MSTLLRTTLLFLGSGVASLQSQVVPIQANVDAQAQRRLQSDAQESIRRRRIEENIRRLLSALDPTNLTGSNGPILTRQSMAALADLQKDNVAPGEAIQQAVKKSTKDSTTTQKPGAYLLECWSSVADRLTPENLPALRKGEELKPPLHLPPYQP